MDVIEYIDRDRDGGKYGYRCGNINGTGFGYGFEHMREVIYINEYGYISGKGDGSGMGDGREFINDGNGSIFNDGNGHGTGNGKGQIIRKLNIKNIIK